MKIPIPDEFWEKARVCGFNRVTDLSTGSSLLPLMTRPASVDTKVALFKVRMKRQDSSKVLLYVQGRCDNNEVGCISFPNCRDDMSAVVGKLSDRFDEDHFSFAKIPYATMFAYYVTLVTQVEAESLCLVVSEQDVVAMISNQGVDPRNFLLQYFGIDLNNHSVKFALVNLFHDFSGGDRAPLGLSVLDSNGIRAYAGETGVADTVHWLNIQSRHTALWVKDGDKTHCLNQPNCNVGPVMFGQNIHDFIPGELDRSLLVTGGQTTVDAVDVISKGMEGYDSIRNQFVTDLVDAATAATARGGAARGGAAQGGAASFRTPVASLVRASRDTNTGTTSAPNGSTDTSPGIRGLLTSPVRSLRGFGGTVADAISGRMRSPTSSAKTSPSVGSPMEIDSEGYDSDLVMVSRVGDEVLAMCAQANDQAVKNLLACQFATTGTVGNIKKTKADREEASKQLKNAMDSFKGAQSDVRVLQEGREAAALAHSQIMADLEAQKTAQQDFFNKEDRNKEGQLNQAKGKVKKCETNVTAANEKFDVAEEAVDTALLAANTAKQNETAAKAAQDGIREDTEKVQRIVRRNGLGRHANPRQIKLVVQYYMYDVLKQELTQASQVVGADNIFSNTRMDAIAGLLRELNYTPPPGFGISRSATHHSLLDRQHNLAKLMGLM